jgi:hypothetical protein
MSEIGDFSPTIRPCPIILRDGKSTCAMRGKALLRRFKIMPLERVKPGDLITAELINQIIDGINRLDKAVAALQRKQHASPSRQKPKRQPSKR